MLAIMYMLDHQYVLMTSCYGLKNDAICNCSTYCQEWDVYFDPAKSHLETFRGCSPNDATLYFASI